MTESIFFCYGTSMNPTGQQSFFSKYKFTLISLFIILLAAIPLLLLSNTAKPILQPKAGPLAQTIPVSPTAMPLTPSSTDATLNQTNTQLQQSLNQVDSDLQTVDTIDSSQDSTTGL